MSGSDVRSRLLAARRALSADQVATLSRELVERFWSGCGIASWKGLEVALYRALPGEPDLRALEARLQAAGARLSFPRILDAADGVMEMAGGTPGPAPVGADPSLRVAFQKGPFGIEEPTDSHPPVDPALLDVVFVPGLAFAPAGERLGMGAGFYDRFLPKAPKAFKIALAFDFQLLPALEQEPWDQRMDWIWTERREILLNPEKPG